MIILPSEIVNKIISYLIEETPTALIIRKRYNCVNCDQSTYKKIYLTCKNNHINCWTCLVKKLQIRDVSCYKCVYLFECLYDEIPHVIDNL